MHYHYLNVPCEECDQCGEKYYTDDVAEKIEHIVNMSKQLMQEIRFLSGFADSGSIRVPSRDNALSIIEV